MKYIVLIHSVLNRRIIFMMILLSFMYKPMFANDDEYVDLPVPEKFIPALLVDGSPKYVSDTIIESEIRKFSPRLKNFYHNHKITQFIVPEHTWFEHLIDIYDKFLSDIQIHAKENTWDCENYSGMLNALTTLRIWNAGYLNTRAAIGWLRVDAKKEWAGKPGTMHALMFAVTSKGFFIIEPQNGQYINFSEYPNKQYIEEVYLY